MFSDTHCHLDLTSVAEIKEAEKMGVKPILVAGTDLESSSESVRLTSDYPSLLACVGLHPWKADQYNDKTLVRLRELSDSDRVVAISEIGLDYLGRRTTAGEYTTECVSKDTQRKVFRLQLKLAKEIGLPVIVHERGALDDILRILVKEKVESSGSVIHGFSGGVGEARRCIGVGAYLSMGQRALNREGNIDFIEAVKWIANDRMLLETDSGNPVDVIKVAEKTAHLKGLTVDEVGDITTSNLKRLIGKRL